MVELCPKRRLNFTQNYFALVPVVEGDRREQEAAANQRTVLTVVALCRHKSVLHSHAQVSCLEI